MFKDARARRAWLLYFLRAEAVLSPLAAPVRRELIEDLKAHVRDILASEAGEEDEFVRLTAALARVGNPREFLAPLLADAVFRAPPKHGSFAMAFRTLSLYASRGAFYFMRAFGLVAVATMGLGILLVSLNSFVRPERAGVFRLGEDDYQVRILGLGSDAGEQLLAPWMAVVLIAAGLCVIAWTVRRARKMLMDVIAGVA